MCIRVAVLFLSSLAINYPTKIVFRNLPLSFVETQNIASPLNKHPYNFEKIDTPKDIFLEQIPFVKLFFLTITVKNYV